MLRPDIFSSGNSTGGLRDFGPIPQTPLYPIPCPCPGSKANRSATDTPACCRLAPALPCAPLHGTRSYHGEVEHSPSNPCATIQETNSPFLGRPWESFWLKQHFLPLPNPYLCPKLCLNHPHPHWVSRQPCMLRLCWTRGHRNPALLPELLLSMGDRASGTAQAGGNDMGRATLPPLQPPTSLLTV